MSSFLFIISFLLHIVLLAVIYYLFQQIQQLKQDNANEITELFETYLKEIKSENKRLEDGLALSDHSTKQNDQTKPSPIVVTNMPKKEHVTHKIDQLPQTDLIDDVFETSLEAQILQLHHQGKEVEEIAKKLNCGKTEADLIINLYEKRKHKA